MGELIDLTRTITDSDIPPAIARDTEFQAADTAHLAATNPHPQYPLKIEGQTFTPTIKDLCLSQGQLSVSANSSVNKCGLEVRASDANSAAFMSFHRPSLIAAHFGIDTDNYLAFGGWSFGENSYKVWHGGFGTPVWQSPSDKRLKKRIKPIDFGLDFLREAKPVSFQYTSEIGQWGESKHQRKRMHYGFLAQEFPLPELISERENGYLGLDYIEIIPVLVQALQEQQAQIQELQAQITALKIS